MESTPASDTYVAAGEWLAMGIHGLGAVLNGLYCWRIVRDRARRAAVDVFLVGQCVGVMLALATPAATSTLALFVGTVGDGLQLLSTLLIAAHAYSHYTLVQACGWLVGLALIVDIGGAFVCITWDVQPEIWLAILVPLTFSAIVGFYVRILRRSQASEVALAHAGVLTSAAAPEQTIGRRILRHALLFGSAFMFAWWTVAFAFMPIPPAGVGVGPLLWHLCRAINTIVQPLLYDRQTGRRLSRWLARYGLCRTCIPGLSEYLVVVRRGVSHRVVSISEQEAVARERSSVRHSPRSPLASARSPPTTERQVLTPPVPMHITLTPPMGAATSFLAVSPLSSARQSPPRPAWQPPPPHGVVIDG
jgi:hypothetical protein